MIRECIASWLDPKIYARAAAAIAANDRYCETIDHQRMQLTLREAELRELRSRVDANKELLESMLAHSADLQRTLSGITTRTDAPPSVDLVWPLETPKILGPGMSLVFEDRPQLSIDVHRILIATDDYEAIFAESVMNGARACFAAMNPVSAKAFRRDDLLEIGLNVGVVDGGRRLGVRILNQSADQHVVSVFAIGSPVPVPSYVKNILDSVEG